MKDHQRRMRFLLGDHGKFIRIFLVGFYTTRTDHMRDPVTFCSLPSQRLHPKSSIIKKFVILFFIIVIFVIETSNWYTSRICYNHIWQDKKILHYVLVLSKRQLLRIAVTHFKDIDLKTIEYTMHMNSLYNTFNHFDLDFKDIDLKTIKYIMHINPRYNTFNHFFLLSKCYLIQLHLDRSTAPMTRTRSRYETQTANWCVLNTFEA